MPSIDWAGKQQAKEAACTVPTHLLKQEAVYGDAEHGTPENLLIQGDNLLALKALMPAYAGRVKCIMIDPPYNTRSAFEHYDDNFEHSQWLSMMYPRLVLLRDLLADDGSIWVTIDDGEAHYLKVLMDEIFGRANFVGNVVWEKVYTPKSNGRGLSGDHDHVLVFAKSPAWLEKGWNLIPRSAEQRERFRNPDNDPEGPWRTYPLDVRTEASARREKYRYEVTLPSGRVVRPTQGRHWALPKEEFDKQREKGAIYFGKDGDAMPTRKVHLKDARQGVIARTWWTYKEVTGNQDAKRELLALLGDTDFITPKPERLIQQILTIASNPGDLVLDSYLGSGTTAAVAHKMGRRYIGIETGDHARSHCIPRLQKVIAGERGGISESVDWQGGGGFRFLTLGEPMFDADGRLDPQVRFDTLASFLWHSATGTAGTQRFDRPLLGTHDGIAYYLLFDDTVRDHALTQSALQMLDAGPKVIYAESTELSAAQLAAAKITFKKIPGDILAR